MASCDGDYGLIGDDCGQTNPSHRAALLRRPDHSSDHQTLASSRYTTRGSQIHLPPPPSIASLDSDGIYPDAALGTPEDPECPFLEEEDPDPGPGADLLAPDDHSDPNSARVHRKDREELSDGSNSYSFKMRKIGGGRGGDYRKDREEWNDTAIAYLLDAYGDKFVRLKRGNLRGRDWEEVSAAVCRGCGNQMKTVEQCKNKVDNLKKRYKQERRKQSDGGVSVSHWPWFEKMDHIVGNPLPGNSVPPPLPPPDEDKSLVASPTEFRQLKRRCTVTTTTQASQVNNLKSKSLSSPRWRRVVFRISGTALAGKGPHGPNVDPKVVTQIANEVAIACCLGVQVAIVIGGRNFFSGDSWVTAAGLDRSTACQIGMMAAVMNSLLLKAALEKHNVQTRVQSAVAMPEITEPYNRQRALRHLAKGRVVIFGGVGAGLGNPLFTSDAAASFRASEIHAEAVVKGTKVDVVNGCSSGEKSLTFEHISFRDVVSSSMDTMALTFCEQNDISVVVFNLLEPGHISKALCGDQVGVLIDRTGRIT